MENTFICLALGLRFHHPCFREFVYRLASHDGQRSSRQVWKPEQLEERAVPGLLGPSDVWSTELLNEHQEKDVAPEAELDHQTNGEILFYDGFSTTTFDESKWASVQGATIDDVGISEPSPCLSLRLNGDPNRNDRIESTTIDLSVVSQATLSYYYERTGGGDSPEILEDLSLEYLDISGTWVELQRHLGDGDDMVTYAQSSLSLPADAFHNAFRISFARDHGTPGPYDDWFVDDVMLTAGAMEDYGDAPAPYATSRADGGAAHVATGPMLGEARDAEGDGQPTAGADGDDLNGTPDDEDGVRFVSSLLVGESADLVVVASAEARLDGWIDFNADGDWTDEGEQVFASVLLAAGENELTVAVPGDAVPSDTYARFRLSSAGGLGPGGAAEDGEVEDYRISVYRVLDDGEEGFSPIGDWDFVQGTVAGGGYQGGLLLQRGWRRLGHCQLVSDSRSWSIPSMGYLARASQPSRRSSICHPGRRPDDRQRRCRSRAAARRHRRCG